MIVVFDTYIDTKPSSLQVLGFPPASEAIWLGVHACLSAVLCSKLALRYSFASIDTWKGSADDILKPPNWTVKKSKASQQQQNTRLGN